MIKAKYTVVLKTLMDNELFMPEIQKALSSYPLYEKKSLETYIPSIVPTRVQLNQKILNAYKYREIGFETPHRFIDELEIAMNEIMPLYNQLLFSADQDFNILFNVDYQRTINRNMDGTSNNSTNASDSTESTIEATAGTEASTTDNTTNTSNVNNNSKNVHSAMPQGEISTAAENINAITHADDVTWNNSNNSDTATTEGASTNSTQTTNNETNTTSGTNSVSAEGSTNESEETLETTKGNFGVVSSQDLILKYRELIVNIEQQIINDERINELFMRIY